MELHRWAWGAIAVVASVGATAVLAAGCGDGGSTTDGGSDTGTGSDGNVISCGANSVVCSGSCVNTQNDNTNCGACGTACTGGQICSQGKCATSCGGGTKLCGSICADTKNDPTNCGACGTTCSTGEVCSAGKCASTCAGSQSFCGGDGGTPYCASTSTDNANCGGCGIACGTGLVCKAGTCTSACGGGTEVFCTPDAGTPYCANTASDNANCGGCGITCGSAQVCQSGACANGCASIDGGTQTLCAPDGGVSYCANTNDDNTNCGTCGNTCSKNQKCVAGVCSGITSSLLIVHASPDYEYDVLSTIQGLGIFQQIDEFDATSATPTLTDLSNYSNTLVYSDYEFADNVTLGDNLADYFDSGGHVLVAVFANTDPFTGADVAGRWASDGYNLIDVQDQEEPGVYGSVIILDSTSPLVAGVTTFSADSAYRSPGTATNGGTVVAEWNDGAALIVAGVTNGKKHAEINFYPPSSNARSDFWTGDGAAILKNALLY